LRLDVWRRGGISAFELGPGQPVAVLQRRHLAGRRRRQERTHFDGPPFDRYRTAAADLPSSGLTRLVYWFVQPAIIILDPPPCPPRGPMMRRLAVFAAVLLTTPPPAADQIDFAH